MKMALGLIEVAGLASSVLVADTMAKTAQVTVDGLEKAKGMGWHTVKVRGNVAAVNAAVSAGEQVAKKCGCFVSSKVIARPADSVEDMFAPDDAPVLIPQSGPLEEQHIPVSEKAPEMPVVTESLKDRDEVSPPNGDVKDVLDASVQDTAPAVSEQQEAQAEADKQATEPKSEKSSLKGKEKNRG